MPRNVHCSTNSLEFIISTVDYNLQAFWWFCISTWLRGKPWNLLIGTIFSWVVTSHVLYCLLMSLLSARYHISLLVNSFRWHYGDFISIFTGNFARLVDSLFSFLWLIWTWSQGARLFSFSPLLHRHNLFWSRIFVPCFTATLSSQGPLFLCEPHWSQC